MQNLFLYSVQHQFHLYIWHHSSGPPVFTASISPACHHRCMRENPPTNHSWSHKRSGTSNTSSQTLGHTAASMTQIKHRLGICIKKKSLSLLFFMEYRINDLSVQHLPTCQIQVKMNHASLLITHNLWLVNYVHNITKTNHNDGYTLNASGMSLKLKCIFLYYEKLNLQ